MRLTLTAVNVVAGIVAIGLTLGTLSLRHAARQARAAQPPPDGGAPPPV
jgi:hypothetical protein